MLDLTRSARTLGFVFLAYFSSLPVLAIVAAVVHGGFHATWFDSAPGWWTWPAPWIFPPLSAVLAADLFRRLARRELRPTQVSGYRVVAVMLLFGAAFAAPRSWHPLAVGVLCTLPLLLPAQRRAAAAAAAP